MPRVAAVIAQPREATARPAPTDADGSNRLLLGGALVLLAMGLLLANTVSVVDFLRSLGRGSMRGFPWWPLLSFLAGTWMAVEGVLAGISVAAKGRVGRPAWLAMSLGAGGISTPIFWLLNGGGSVSLGWILHGAAGGTIMAAGILVWLRRPQRTASLLAFIGAGLAVMARVPGIETRNLLDAFSQGSSPVVFVSYGLVLLQFALAAAWFAYVRDFVRTARGLVLGGTLVFCAGALFSIRLGVNLLGSGASYPDGAAAERIASFVLGGLAVFLFAAAAVAALAWVGARFGGGLRSWWLWVGRWSSAIVVCFLLSTWFGLTQEAGLLRVDRGADFFGQVWGNGFPEADGIFTAGTVVVIVTQLCALRLMTRVRDPAVRLGASVLVAFATGLGHWVVYAFSFQALPASLKNGDTFPLRAAFDFTWQWGLIGLVAASAAPMAFVRSLARPARQTATAANPAAAEATIGSPGA